MLLVHEDFRRDKFWVGTTYSLDELFNLASVRAYWRRQGICDIFPILTVSFNLGAGMVSFLQNDSLSKNQDVEGEKMRELPAMVVLVPI
jgi:hypothetical protein